KLRSPDLELLGAQAQHVEMPRVLDSRLRVRCLERGLGAERLAVGARYRGAPAHEFIGAGELSKPYRGVHVGKIVLEAGVVNFVVPRAAAVVALPRVAVHPVQAGDRDSLGEGVVL